MRMEGARYSINGRSCFVFIKGGNHMKKYRCPYCGEPTRRWYHKSRPKATNLFGDFLSVCPNCKHRVPLAAHPLYWVCTILADVTVGLSVVFICLRMMLWVKIFFILTVILLIMRMVIGNLFQKFTVDTDEDKRTTWQPAEIVFDSSIHNPQIFLNSTSVVQLRPAKQANAASVRIEPIKALGGKKYKCKLASIQMTAPYESGTEFSIEENGKVLGQGLFI